MEQNKKMGKFDIDIEIKDLLWEFARKWRLIVILAVVCGVGLAAYQYRIDMNKTDVVTVKKTQEELEKSMGEQDLDEVTAAVALKRQLDEKSAYMEASLLMKVNPYAENAVMLQYYVSAEEETGATDATEAYKMYIENDILAQEIAKTGSYELEALYLAELISIEKEEGHVYVNAKNESVNLAIQPNEAKHTFSVKVVAGEAEEAQVLAADVKKALESYNTSLTSVIGQHDLQLVGESSGVIVDQSLAEHQNWNATAIKTISNNLDSMKNEMTSDQISLYVYRTTVTKETVGSASTTTAAADKTVSISMKHLVIGVIVGIVLACALIFALYLFAPALRSSEEIKTLYGINVIGRIDDTKFGKKKLFGFVDSLIVKLQNIRKKKLTFEQEVQMICANIALDCKNNAADKVFLTTSVSEQIPNEVQNAIVEKCAQKGIQVVIGQAISYDAEALEQMAQIGRVVFIERARISLYDELYSEIALCKNNQIHVIGMIILGA